MGGWLTCGRLLRNGYRLCIDGMLWLLGAFGVSVGTCEQHGGVQAAGFPHGTCHLPSHAQALRGNWFMEECVRTHLPFRNSVQCWFAGVREVPHAKFAPGRKVGGLC